MGSILVALVALAVMAGLIIGGTGFSLYLFLLKAQGTSRFAQHRPVAEERILFDNAYSVKQPFYTETLNPGSSSARFARNSFIVIAFSLLLMVMVAISMVAGTVH